MMDGWDGQQGYSAATFLRYLASQSLENIWIHFSFFFRLINLVRVTKTASIIKLILASIDPRNYHEKTPTSVLLSMARSHRLETARMFTVRLLRVWLRAGAHFFPTWGIGQLAQALYDTDCEVKSEALDVLEEACTVEVFLCAIIDRGGCGRSYHYT